MFDRVLKDKIKPLTLGVIKEIVKKVDGLVPDDTPVVIDGQMRLQKHIKVARHIENYLDGEQQYVSAHLLHCFNLKSSSFGFVWDVTNGVEEVDPQLMGSIREEFERQLKMSQCLIEIYKKVEEKISASA
jgi:hypothetical protein